MNVIIFDIDGTLTQTTAVDTECFMRAVENVLQIQLANTDWAAYQYSTDSGLLKEIYELHFQRIPLANEIEFLRNRFVEYLHEAWHKDKSRYIALPGAQTIFSQITQLGEWHIAIATGGWKKSALFKLNSAQIPHTAIPKAFADDHIERTEIIKKALNLAQEVNSVSQYQRIVYVGDREWDQRAAAALNIDFIGVGPAFSHLSSSLALADYQDDALLHFLTA